MQLDKCPKCGFDIGRPAPDCPKCGILFAKFTPERKKVYASQVIVSTTMLSEPVETIGPVYAVTTNREGVLDRAAKQLGIDIRAIQGDEVVSALIFGDSVANFRAFPVAFKVCTEQLRREALALGADAVIGVRMNFDLDRSGVGLMAFTMQLFGTAVRRK